MKKEFYLGLLQSWCDRLISLQIKEIEEKELYGGLLCPSCARIHGRCVDAVYPFLFLADYLGDDKYLESAKMLFDWGENMTRPGGYYINDTNSAWDGISVFTTIALGEALFYHGHLLDEKTREKWQNRMKKAIEHLYTTDLAARSNINYPITCSASMALAYKIFGDEKYKERARNLAHEALDYFTPEGLIFGEGKPHDIVTPKGCRAIDLGYNVEESLGGLATYAYLMDDELIKETLKNSLYAHLDFMLPDGAWDNSWGSRSSKWTYWGSRTSDGCQIAYGVMSAENPIFEEAAYRNAQLLKKCTHNGLLHGGPMYASADEPACSHHTFCHAKSIANILEHMTKEETPPCLLPSEELKGSGFKYFKSINTLLIHAGDYRATVTDYDYLRVKNGNPSGGTLSMLWHKKTEAILAASMTKYNLVEPNNMQIPQYYENITLTPRVECGNYFSCNDKSAKMFWEQDGESVFVCAKGNLRDEEQEKGGEYEIKYNFNPQTITFGVDTDEKDAYFILPIIAEYQDEIVQINECEVNIRREKSKIIIKTNSNIIINKENPRIFNPVGGFCAVVLMLKDPKGLEIVLKVE